LLLRYRSRESEDTDERASRAVTSPSPPSVSIRQPLEALDNSFGQQLRQFESAARPCQVLLDSAAPATEALREFAADAEKWSKVAVKLDEDARRAQNFLAQIDLSPAMKAISVAARCPLNPGNSIFTSPG